MQEVAVKNIECGTMLKENNEHLISHVNHPLMDDLRRKGFARWYHETDWRPISCWYDGQPLGDWEPCFVPHSLDSESGDVAIFGVCHSLGAVKAYLGERGENRKLEIVAHYARRWYADNFPIVATVARSRLQGFGGDLDLESFRNSGTPGVLDADAEDVQFIAYGPRYILCVAQTSDEHEDPVLHDPYDPPGLTATASSAAELTFQDGLSSAALLKTSLSQSTLGEWTRSVGKRDLWCWYDGLPLSRSTTTPVPIPIAWDDMQKAVSVHGVCRSLAGAKAYLKERWDAKTPMRLEVLAMIGRKWYGVTAILQATTPKEMLACYGGVMTPSQFFPLYRGRVIFRVDPPFVAYHPVARDAPEPSDLDEEARENYAFFPDSKDRTSWNVFGLRIPTAEEREEEVEEKGEPPQAVTTPGLYENFLTEKFDCRTRKRRKKGEPKAADEYTGYGTLLPFFKKQ